MTHESSGSYSEGAAGREMAAPLWSLSVRWEEDFHWNHSVSQFVVRLSLRTEVWLIFSEGRKSSFGRTGSAPEERKRVVLCLFVCLFVWPAADCGSVVGRWEELQPDAGRWWMSAGFKVRSCRGTSLSLMWKKKREKTREYWVFSVRDEECEEDRQGGNSSTACLSACLSVCLLDYKNL